MLQNNNKYIYKSDIRIKESRIWINDWNIWSWAQIIIIIIIRTEKKVDENANIMWYTQKNWRLNIHNSANREEKNKTKQGYEKLEIEQRDKKIKLIYFFSYIFWFF